MARSDEERRTQAITGVSNPAMDGDRVDAVVQRHAGNRLDLAAPNQRGLEPRSPIRGRQKVNFMKSAGMAEPRTAVFQIAHGQIESKAPAALTSGLPSAELDARPASRAGCAHRDPRRPVHRQHRGREAGAHTEVADKTSGQVKTAAKTASGGLTAGFTLKQ